MLQFEYFRNVFLTAMQTLGNVDDINVRLHSICYSVFCFIITYSGNVNIRRVGGTVFVECLVGVDLISRKTTTGTMEF